MDGELDKSSSKAEIGVWVKDVNLHYSGNAKPTLINMNMNIPKGAIYGLLGPSGCGKTSVLRCILGRALPKSGEIRVFGHRPGTKASQIPGPGVGYMPQDTALYNEFSIQETINYFATIFSLSHEVKKSRLQNLLKFLDLPDKNRLVKNLSGGQKRRVSIAATLVHKPKLLILDEPTVGVDPLLRESIWQHLYELTQTEQMTIIITTHYIEEARLAHVIGLMRMGSLLVEENPQALMMRYVCSNLEEVFLKICHMQKQPEQIRVTQPDDEENNNERQTEEEQHPLVDQMNHLNTLPEQSFMRNGSVDRSSLKSEMLHQQLMNIYNDTTYQKRRPTGISAIMPHFTLPSSKGTPGLLLDHFNKTCSQIRKSIVKTQRNLGLITFQLMLPTITMIFFCLCIGNSPANIDMAVFNDEVNAYNYSHDFINQLDDKVFNLHFYDTEEDAIESVREGHNWGAIVVNANYSYGLKDRLENYYQLSNASLAASVIKYYSDQTEMPIQLAIGKGLLDAGVHYASIVMKKILPELEPEVISTPMFERMTPIYGQLDTSFRDYVAPALVLAVTYAMSQGLTALSFVQERKEGLFERSLVSGVSTVHIFFAHFIVEFCMVLIQTAVMLYFMFYVFQVPCFGSVWLVLALTLFQGMCGMSLGLLISSICQDERNAIMLTIGMFYPTLVLTGIIWPIEAMPKYMLHFVYFLPQTMAVKGMRSIISKAWTFADPEVSMGFASTFVWILFFNMAALIIFSRR